MRVTKKERQGLYNQAIELLKQGYSIESAAKEVGVKYGSLYRHLFVTDSPYRKKPICSTIEPRFYEVIKLRYEGGESSVDLANDFSVSDDTILRLLKTLGVEIRDKSHLVRYRVNNYSIDESAFTDTSTEECAYYTGWLLTDGCISDSGRVSLELQLQDKCILEGLRAYVKTSNEIYYRSRLDERTGATNHGGVVYFTNQKISETLRNLNIVPRKSLKERCPEVFRNNRHFWRGAIEGDGHISYRGSYRLYLYGSKDFTNSFKEYVESLGVTARVRSSTAGLYMCVVGIREQVKFILEHLYKDCKLYLPRKYEVYKEYYSD